VKFIYAEGLGVAKTISNDVWAPRSGVESFRVMYSMVKMGRNLEMSHLSANSTRRTSEEQGGTRSFLELPTRPIRGTSVAPALLPRAGRIPDLIYG
jgi:hypothetical protein